ncbi:MAG: hypothetical protein ACXWLR_10075, partial [Myxococcales bacterium]
MTTPDGGGSADGGVDGGVAADCEGLVPASPGAAFTFDVLAYDNGETCDASAIDGEGVVAAAARGASGTTWYEFAPNYGSRSGNFGTQEVFAQPRGFIGLWGTATVNVTLFDQGGSVTYASPVGSGAVVLGPAAGSGVVSLAATSTALTVRKHDAGASEVASANISGAFVPRAAAEDAGGSVLALTGAGSEVSGLWVDLAKGTAGQPFPIGTGSSVRARPLFAGGVAVQIDGRWAGIAQPGEVAIRSAPAWLGSAADFAPARSGKAYALFPRSGSTVGIVSAQGNACGAVAFPGVSSVALGEDGTVAGATGP